MKRKVVDYRNLPTHLPTFPTIAIGLLLDRLKAQPWVWGFTGAVLLLVWVAAIYAALTETKVRLWEQDR